MKLLGSQLPTILRQRANRLRELNRQLYSVLPVEFHGHVQVAGLKHDLLTLEADSPVWATKVRYHSNDLARQLSVKTGLTIKSVKSYVQPPDRRPEPARRKKPAISGYSAKSIESLAKSIKHPGLKQALSKLSKRGK